MKLRGFVNEVAFDHVFKVKDMMKINRIEVY